MIFFKMTNYVNYMRDLDGPVTFDNRLYLTSVFIAPAAKLETERKVGRHECTADDLAVLFDDRFGLGAEEDEEFQHTTNCPESETRVWHGGRICRYWRKLKVVGRKLKFICITDGMAVKEKHSVRRPIIFTDHIERMGTVEVDIVLLNIENIYTVSSIPILFVKKRGVLLFWFSRRLAKCRERRWATFCNSCHAERSRGCFLPNHRDNGWAIWCWSRRYCKY